jgi:hypothetical protein
MVNAKAASPRHGGGCSIRENGPRASRSQSETLHVITTKMDRCNHVPLTAATTFIATGKINSFIVVTLGGFYPISRPVDRFHAGVLFYSFDHFFR